MPPLESSAHFPEISRLEARRDSRVLILAASSLDIELLPALYDTLSAMGRQRRLDVVVHSRGGVVNGARRIALLLREFTDHLGLIVPYFCESSSTILALAADEIIAGDLAIFSPIDPQLHGSGGEGDSTFSCMDIRQFGALCADWFGVDEQEARAQSLPLLCSSVFPPSLTAFYRSTLELEQIGEELLRFQRPDLAPEQRLAVVRQLMYGYHSHNYALTGAQLGELGLALRRDGAVEALAWQVSKQLQSLVGRGVNESPDDPWHDALLATRERVSLRRRLGGGFHPRWEHREHAL